MQLDANRKDTARHYPGHRNVVNYANQMKKGTDVNNTKNFASSATSAIHKLDTIVSSDSYSTGSTSLSAEMGHLEDVGSPRSALLTAADDWYQTGWNTHQNRAGNSSNDRRDERNISARCQVGHASREVTPPPPPPPPAQQLLSNCFSLNENGNRSFTERQNQEAAIQYGGDNMQSSSSSDRQLQQQQQLSSQRHHQQQQSQQPQQSLSSSQQNNHKQALISLLQQLKESETSHARLQKQYESEKVSLLETLSKQEEHLNNVYSKLNAAQTELEKIRESKREKAALAKILRQLSNFAKGCHDYSKTSNSASVRKMSDALKIQVGEWAKCNDVDLHFGSSGADEAEDMSSMEMIQSLQLEVKMLRLENAVLKKQPGAMARDDLESESNLEGHNSVFDSRGGSTDRSGRGYTNSQVSNGVVDDSDEVSHLSGTTSMSSGTKISAMAGFPTDFEDTRQNNERKSARQAMPPTHSLNTCAKNSTSSRISPPRSATNTSSLHIPPRRAGRKVHIHATPQILTNAINEDSWMSHEEPIVASSSPRSIMKKPTYGTSSSHLSRQGVVVEPGHRLLHPSQFTSDMDERDDFVHGFARFDEALVNDEFGDGYSEV
ncbi:hypothetical protein HJC23_002277 [Cyclotella cryptica]|uniref:Centrosomal protein POC5 n=1 Tax=Cyclotella cryptica TaxID=29204 RepID=A0ABD3QFJ4_9STRA|eukprot:CCRYP_005755-RA/>CCRYP_005755-RA protein AED:0.26 eAED:0.26 QI:0/-1/0/1/-1/1/1/0/605